MRKAALLVVVLAVSSLASSCGDSESPEDVARRVAAQWTASSVREVTQTLVDAVVDTNPILEQVGASLLADQIGERVSWSYSSPARENGDSYRVRTTATTSVDIDLALIRRAYDISFSFDLTIDVGRQEVASWSPDLGSLEVEER